MDLLADVERRYAALHAPAWPDPHPWGQSPRDDEYSRVSEPERYRIVEQRLDCWAAVLIDAGLADRRDPSTARPVGRSAVPLTWELVPRSAGAMTLGVALRRFTEPDAPIVAADIAGGRDGRWLVVDQAPYCGCDACDSGSTTLLEQIDQAVMSVVAGRLAGVQDGDSYFIATADGSRSSWSSGSPELPAAQLAGWADAVRAGGPTDPPPGLSAGAVWVAGAPWLSA